MNLAICSSGELYGGVEEWICTYVRYVREYQPWLNVSVILFSDGRLATRLRQLGVEPAIVSGRHKYDLVLLRQIRALLEANRIDVVHTHGYKADILCGFVARRLRLRLIKTQHGSVESPRLFSSSGLRLMINDFLAERFERVFAQVVFVTYDLMKSRGKKKSKWTVIYNGIPPVNFSPGEARSLKGDSFVVAIVGRLSDIKGHRYLLEAVHSLRGRINNLRLWIFGDGPLEKTLRAYCKEHSLDTVDFLGFKENVHDYLSECDVFCMPSLHEGLPYALLEAMYLKIPVIASGVGGLREVLSDGQDALLVEPKNAMALADALLRLYENTDLRTALSERAHQKVTAQFMIGTMVEKYLSLL